MWLAPAHVVRLSSGRFRDAFAHEAAVLALLPDAVPHAEVVAHGHAGTREWMILRRIKGRPLIQAWRTLSAAKRLAATEQLGGILQALHGVRVPEGFHNPSLDDALSPTGNRRDAYHDPPAQYQLLLEAAAGVPGVDRSFLDAVGAFIAERLSAFQYDQTATPSSSVCPYCSSSSVTAASAGSS